MRNALKYFLILLAIAAMMSFVACSDDDDDDDGGTTTPPVVDAWVGEWLSAGDNVAPILIGLDVDEVRVTFRDDATVTTEQHMISTDSWVTLEGAYSVTESSSGDIHAIEIEYSGLSQAGIIQVIDGSPDQMLLEVIQLGIGFDPRTPTTGFSTEEDVLPTTNIQTYVRVD